MVTVAFAMLAAQIAELVPRAGEIRWADDFQIVTDAARRWLEGGPFYPPEQLAGPFGGQGAWILYPPPMLVLFAAFVFVPWPLYWMVPIATVAAVVAYHRPRPLALGAIALILANPTTLSTFAWGNPGLWLVAALALGTIYGWPAAALLLKPTLLPFALVGVWRRSWWLAVAAGAVVSLAFLPMWGDYLRVAGNWRPPGGLAYSLPQSVLMLLPIAAWLGGRHAPTR